MKKTIEIEDTLLDREETTREEVRDAFTELKAKFSGDKLREKLEDLVHEIADSNTPIYNGEIRDTIYLHPECEDAFDESGIYNQRPDNWMQIAICIHLENVAREELEKQLSDH